MLKNFKNIGHFERNVILVFLGSSIGNFLNLLYQLLIAHKFTAADFAAFNALISIFALFSTPLGTLQTAIVKYTSGFNAHSQIRKIQILLTGFLKKTMITAVCIFLVFYGLSFHMLDKLKIPSSSSGLVLALMLAFSCVAPVFAGGIQGLEFFGWVVGVGIISGILKLILTYILLVTGFKITGALAAFLASILCGVIISYFPLKDFFSFRNIPDGVDLREVLLYILPVAISIFCFAALVNLDMVLVRYFFSPENSGLYALGQMVGKIFLFLPGAISVVMFPRTSGLNAQNKDTVSTLKKSLFYVSLLCTGAILLYNLFPHFILKILTGKTSSEAVFLGRLFSISMSFYALIFMLMNYFLSIKDLRFIKYFVLFTVLQLLAIGIFHRSLVQVQLILCLSASMLLGINFPLALRKRI